MKYVDLIDLETYIGKSLGQSGWFVIDQERINAFADVTLDHQFIHVDAEKAALTPLGGTVAHGFLTLSMMSYLLSDMPDLVAPKGSKMSMNYGFDKVRFLVPVRPGAEIRSQVILTSVEEKSAGQWLLSYACSIEIKGESKPALVADWLALYVI